MTLFYNVQNTFCVEINYEKNSLIVKRNEKAILTMNVPTKIFYGENDKTIRRIYDSILINMFDNLYVFVGGTNVYTFRTISDIRKHDVFVAYDDTNTYLLTLKKYIRNEDRICMNPYEQIKVTPDAFKDITISF